MSYTGAVVQATAGHDKGGLFLVVAEEENFLFLVNGKRRKLANPKKKKLHHVALVSKEMFGESPQSDKALRRALVAFEKEGITLGKRRYD